MAELGHKTSGRVAWRHVWRSRVIANAQVGLTRVAYMLFWVIPAGALELDVSEADRARTIVFFLVFVCVGTPISYWHCRRLFRPVAEWLDADRSPTVSEQLTLLRQPRAQAMSVVAYWAVAGLALAVMYLGLFERNLAHAALLLLGPVFLGLHVGAFVFLRVERTLRPIVAAAMAAGTTVRLEMLSVHARILLSWAFGPGVSIVGIAIFLMLRSDASSGDIGAAIWPIVVLALVEGYQLASWTATSVTRPIAEVRAGMRQILEGDLTAGVAVDAGSEVGLLQIGFNRMATGLREREWLSELVRQRTGVEVARQALEKGPDFKGVEVRATVLFVDLIGSTSIAEWRPASELAATLNALFDAVVRTVDDQDGWVNKFAGDGAICVFGALDEPDDHAARALRVARCLRQEIGKLATAVPWLDAGIGVSSGPVLTVDVGSRNRFEFTIVGDAANEAARLSELAKQRDSRVLVSERTIELAGVVDGWVPSGTVALRGKSRPTAVYEPGDSLLAAPAAGA